MSLAAITAGVKRSGEAHGFNAMFLRTLPADNDLFGGLVSAKEVLHSDAHRPAFNQIVDKNLVCSRHLLENQIFLDQQTHETNHSAHPAFDCPERESACGRTAAQADSSASTTSYTFGCVAYVCTKVVGDGVEHFDREAHAAVSGHDEGSGAVWIDDIEILPADLHIDRLVNENWLHSSTLILVGDAIVCSADRLRSFPIRFRSVSLTKVAA